MRDAGREYCHCGCSGRGVDCRSVSGRSATDVLGVVVVLITGSGGSSAVILGCG